MEALIRSGMTDKEIANELGMSPNGVAKRRRRWFPHIQTTGDGLLDQSERATIAEMRANGDSIKVIARRLKRASYMVHCYIRAENLPKGKPQRGGRTTSPDVVAKVKALWADGLERKQIAIDLGFSQAIINDRIRELLLAGEIAPRSVAPPIPERISATPEQAAQIREMADSGMKWAEIRKHFDWSESTMFRVANELGIRKRRFGQGEAKPERVIAAPVEPVAKPERQPVNRWPLPPGDPITMQAIQVPWQEFHQRLGVEG